MATSLTQAELGIMQRLWLEPDQTARQILEALYPGDRTSQHGTVQKLLQRLEDKNFVTRDRTSAVQTFRAIVTQQSYLSDELESLAAQLTGGKLAPLVTALLEEKKFSRAELAQLRRIVDAK